MKRTYPDLLWCRYADDGLVHCRTEREAEALKAALQARLAECHLELHPIKTRIVYCKDRNRKAVYPNVTFDFLGYCFRPRLVKNVRTHQLFWGFNPAASPAALKEIRSTIRALRFRRQTQLSWWISPIGSTPSCGVGLSTTGRYTPSALQPIFWHVNLTLLRWARRKFKRFEAHSTQAWSLSGATAREQGASLRTLASRNERWVCLMGAV